MVRFHMRVRDGCRFLTAELFLAGPFISMNASKMNIAFRLQRPCTYTGCIPGDEKWPSNFATFCERYFVLKWSGFRSLIIKCLANTASRSTQETQRKPSGFWSKHLLHLLIYHRLTLWIRVMNPNTGGRGLGVASIA